APVLAGAEVVVPVPHGVAGVQDRGHLLVLAGRAQGGVLREVPRGRQELRRDAHDVGRAGGERSGDPAGRRRDDTRLAAVGGQQPQGGDRVGTVGGVRVGPGGGEQEVTGARERGGRLALRRAGQAAGRPLARRVHLPQGRAVRGALAVERLHRG